MQQCKSNHEQGSVMVTLLIVLITVGGLASVLLTRSSQTHNLSSAAAENSRLLFVAEAGLNMNYLQMEVDPFYPVKDTTKFSWDAEKQVYRSGTITMRATAQATPKYYKLKIQYLNDKKPVVFADRTNPVEKVDQILITAQAESNRGSRAVTALYRFTGYAVEGVINSDMTPSGGPTGTGRTMGQAGHVAISGDGDRNEVHIWGDIMANGAITFEDGVDGWVTLTKDNASKYIASFTGKAFGNLAGTIYEIPDFTKIGEKQQLFNLARLEAAAAGGAGQIFYGTQAFNDAMDLANSGGRPLEGIQVVKVDPTVANPNFTVDINIQGALVVLFDSGTDPFEKLEFTGKLQINPANLSSLVPADETTYTTGYPALYSDPTKNPKEVDITPTYENFTADEDLPALIFNTGVMDIHGPVNVCGMVYSASYLEIENTGANWQYFLGAMYSGGGIWFRANGSAGAATMVKWDSNKVDRLQTVNTGGPKLKQIGFALGKKSKKSKKSGKSNKSGSKKSGKSGSKKSSKSGSKKSTKSGSTKSTKSGSTKSLKSIK